MIYQSIAMQYERDSNKSKLNKKKRWISFEEIVQAINKGWVIQTIRNKNYPEQNILIVEVPNIKNLVCVACEMRWTKMRLITAYESRKYTKLLK